MPKYFKKHLLSGAKKNTGEAETGNNSDPESSYLSSLATGESVQTLLSWRAPSRPFRKKDKSYYTTAIILVILVSLIALLAGYLMLIVALLALLFLVYVLNFVPPEEVNYKISTQGVTIEDHFYHWQELDSFWFSKKDGIPMLHILTHLRFPGVLMLVLNTTVSEEALKKVCAQYLPFQEIAPQSALDKWSNRLQKAFPLEKPKV